MTETPTTPPPADDPFQDPAEQPQTPEQPDPGTQDPDDGNDPQKGQERAGKRST